MIPYSARPWTAQREREWMIDQRKQNGLHVFLFYGDAKLNPGEQSFPILTGKRDPGSPV